MNDQHGINRGATAGLSSSVGGAAKSTAGQASSGTQYGTALPRVIIAGTASGVGKTSLALGIVRALRSRVCGCKRSRSAPISSTPPISARASGRTCYNLDAWMTSPEYVRRLFARAAADADLAVIEGVMGLFDGASPAALEGSTAEIASLLHAPIVLVVNAHGAARSLAATVKGFAEFEPGLSVAGVIANQSGSSRHAAWLSEALASAALPPLVGATPRGALPTLQSRHLGLATADEAVLDEATLDALADACAEHLDMPRLLEIARSEALSNCQGARASSPPLPPGEGRGEGNLHRSQNRTAESPPGSPHPNPLPKGEGDLKSAIFKTPMKCVKPFVAAMSAWGSLATRRSTSIIPTTWNRSPRRGPSGRSSRRWPTAACRKTSTASTSAAAIPRSTPPGWPPTPSLLADVRRFAASGRAVYAECGGLMYLGATHSARSTAPGKPWPASCPWKPPCSPG